jgi:hypothetical protein
VAFGHETTGLTADCAPSRTIGSSFIEDHQVRQLIAAGYAVALTDFEGLGVDGIHTYMVEPSQSHALLDSVRALWRIPGVGVTPASPVALWGYSQGAGAASWAAEDARAYAPEIPLVGVAAGGVPGDLVELTTALDGGYFAFLAGAAVGFSAAYPELDLLSYLTPEAGQEIVTALSGSFCVNDMLSTFVGRRITDYTTRNPLDEQSWKDRLGESTIGRGGRRPTVPAYVYHAADDDLIPFATGKGARDRWCAAGATVQWSVIGSGGHVGGEFTGTPGALSWLADRFSGRAAPANC